MKKLKITMCALLVLCSGFVFAACGEKDKSFDVSKITVGETTTFTYDGKSHIIEVEYDNDNLDVDIEYAVVDSVNAKVDKDDFDDELNLKNAGTYHVYYKLSADGYKDYISKQSYKMTITQRVVDLDIKDVVKLKSDGITSSVVPTYTYPYGSVVRDDVLSVLFSVGDAIDGGEAFNASTVQPGRVFKVTGRSLNNNYVVRGEGKLYIKDLVEVISSTTTTYYGSLAAAFEAAPAGATVKLNKNIEVAESINLNKSLTIDGQGKYSIKANSSFTDGNVILMETAGVELTLKDITIDGNAKARVIKVQKGKLTLQDTHITNGKTSSFVGGVFVTEAAQFVMNGGSIKNNTYVTSADDDYSMIYSKDLWIGANATGAVNEITNAEIGQIFVNANEYSNTNPGSFTLDGGEVDSIYVEYDKGFGAKFIYKDGEIGKLMVAATVNGEFAELSVPTAETTIVGGLIGTSTDGEGFTKGFVDPTEFMTYAYQHLEDYKKVYLCDSFWLANTVDRVQEVVLIGDIELHSTQAITFTEYSDSVVINGQGKYSITASEAFTGDNLFNVTGNDADTTVTLKDITLDGNNKARVIRVDSGKLIVDGATITKGLAKDYVGGVFITYAASFEMTSGSITGNSYAGATAGDEYYKVYSKDLWIGANATGSLIAINGGEVGNIYVNSNEYSANNPGFFTMSAGEVDNLYVEYDAGFGAVFNFEGGVIDKLYLSTQTTGTAQLIENPTANRYVGGTGVVA